MGRLTTSEIEGIHVIEDVIHQVSDRRIRKMLDKHLDDEKRHARVFGERYKAMQKEAGIDIQPPPSPAPREQRFNLLTLVAYLETQEARAIALLEAYKELFAGDEESVKWLERNIKDEKFHATWTHMQLERWIKEGMAEEVRQARVQAQQTDRRAFWIQVFSFLRVMPRLIIRGHLPPLFSKQPAPM